MQTAITEQSINPANIEEKDRPSWPIASLKGLLRTRSSCSWDQMLQLVAIGTALSHGNVNTMI